MSKLPKVKSIEIEIHSGYSVTMSPSEARRLHAELSKMFGEAAAKEPNNIPSGALYQNETFGSYFYPGSLDSNQTMTDNANSGWSVTSIDGDFEVKKG